MCGGCTSVSIVNATAGLRRSNTTFAAFDAVHITTCVPFQLNPIGPTPASRSVRTSNCGGRLACWGLRS